MADDIPPDSKLTTTKQRWAEQHRFLTGATPAERQRLPPGQHLVRDWPVLDLGVQPPIDPARWTLRVFGAVAEALTWDWDAFLAQDQQEDVSDIHCVTTWSRYDNRWQGVPTAALLRAVRPTPEATAVVLHSHDGYTTNLTLEDFAAPGAMLVHSWEGKPLTTEHGAPVRLVVPHLYFWKSAKWLQRIEITTATKPGFWEVRGYHERGDPWAEQRYSK